MIFFALDRVFLKGLLTFFLISVVFTFSSCATFQEKIQEEEDFSDSSDSSDSSVLEEPIADTKLPPQNARATPDAVLQVPVVLPAPKVMQELPAVVPAKKVIEETPDVAIPIASLPSQTQFMKDSPDYLLGPEDVIQVLVWKDDALTRTVMIRPDGKIALPLVGEQQAAGMTPNALASEVKKSLQKYYKEQPEVSVIVTEINSFSVFVLGEIARPGKYNLRRETTLLQALSLAGGFKEYADTKKILLLRKEGSTEKRIHINYKNLISGKVPEDNVALRAGDTLIIP